MKKLKILFIILFIFLCVGCKNNDSNELKNNNDNMLDSQTIKIKNYSSGMTTYHFENYNLLIKYAEKNLNDNHFYSLNTEMIQNEIEKNLSISYKFDENDNVKNTCIHEYFYIYDESLGNHSDELTGEPYWSIMFNFDFYPTDEEINNTICNITEKGMYISLRNDYSVLGTIDIEYGHLNAEEYVRSYISKNLKRI